MWTDIGTSYRLDVRFLKLTSLSDYMYKRRVFTLDPDYFPLKRMREIIDYLHANKQQYGKRLLLNLGLSPLTSRLNQSS